MKFVGSFQHVLAGQEMAKNVVSCTFYLHFGSRTIQNNTVQCLKEKILAGGEASTSGHTAEEEDDQLEGSLERSTDIPSPSAAVNDAGRKFNRLGHFSGQKTSY